MNEETLEQTEQPEQETQLGPTPLLSPSDPLSLAPLNALAETVAAKADADELPPIRAALEALQTDLGSGGNNCRIYVGNYEGNGAYGSNNQVTLRFPFQPKLVVVLSRNEADAMILVAPCTTGQGIGRNPVQVTWGDRVVSYYANDGKTQARYCGYHYYYVAFGPAA